MFRSDRFAPVVTRGLDPRVHLFRKKMDCRVKPGNDAEEGQSELNPLWRSLFPRGSLTSKAQIIAPTWELGLPEVRQ